MLKKVNWLRWCLLAVVVVPLVLFVASIWITPWAIRKYALPMVKTATKHDLLVDKMVFNPFRLRLKLEGIRLQNTDGTSLGSIKSLVVDVSSGSIWARYPVFDSIRCADFELVVERRKDGSLNWQDLVDEPPSQRRRAPAPTAPATLPSLRIEELALTHGRIRLIDKTVAQPRAKIVDNIDIGLTRFATTPGLDNRLSITATEESGGSIQWNGNVTFGPIRSSGLLLIDNVNIAAQKDYLPEGLNFDLRRAVVTASIEYIFKADDLQRPIQFKLNELKLVELIVAHLDGSDWIEIPQIVVTKGTINPSDHQAAIESVAIEDGTAIIKRLDSGQLEIPGFLASTSDSTSGKEGDPGSQWHLKLNRFALDNFSLDWVDQSVSPAAALSVKAITVEVEGYQSNAEEPVTLLARVGTQETGFLRLVGDLQLSPVFIDAKLSIQNWPIGQFQPYWQSMAAVSVPTGRFNSEVVFTVKLPSDAPLQAKATGQFSIDSLEAVPTGGEIPLIAWHALAVDNFNYDSVKNQLEVGSIIWRQPSFTLEREEDGTLSIAQLFPADSAKAVVPAEPIAQDKSPPIHLKLGQFVVEDASGRFRDYTVQPHYNLRLEGFSGAVKGISDNPEEKASIEMRGMLDGHSALTVTGSMQPLAIKSFADVNLSVNALDMTGFSPFAGKFVGYPFQKGKLSLNLAYKINQSKLDARNKVLIDRMEFGPSTNSPDATKLPVKLGVALLQDMNGRIDINLPISGDLDDPNFRYGRLVWQALGNILIKAAASPFNLLGGLIGGGKSEDLSTVAFTPGDASLSETEQKSLRDLAEALGKRPQLKLELAGSFDSVGDSTAMRDQAFEHALHRQAGIPDGEELSAETRTEALASLYVKTFNRPAPVEPVTTDVDAVSNMEPGAEPASVTAPDASVAKAEPHKPRRGFWNRLFGRKQKAEVVVAPPPPPPPEPVYNSSVIEEELVPEFAPKPADLLDLARSREAVVRDFLVKEGGVSPDRVFIVAPAAGSKTGTEVQFTLVP